jgi:hypothetical protein
MIKDRMGKCRYAITNHSINGKWAVTNRSINGKISRGGRGDKDFLSLNLSFSAFAAAAL